jgi:hypothetical protein
MSALGGFLFNEGQKRRAIDLLLSRFSYDGGNSLLKLGSPVVLHWAEYPACEPSQDDEAQDSYSRKLDPTPRSVEEQQPETNAGFNDDCE